MLRILFHCIPLDGHFHIQLRMWVVTLHDKVLQLEPIDVPNFLYAPPELERRELPRLSCQLHLELGDMVDIDVRVPQLHDELVRASVGNERDHVREERVGGDVEGDPEAEVGGALVHEAREAGTVGGGGIGGESDVELAEHVAGREGHDAEICDG